MQFLNLYEATLPLIQAKKWHWNLSRRLEKVTPSILPQTPWCHFHQINRYCDIWQDIFFTSLRVLPSFCLDCFKIVLRPKTCLELFKLAEYMQQYQGPCKCGLETRKTVPALYGGYFYARGVEEGRKLFKMLAVEFPSAILKRGCTEFEHYFGRSDFWQVSQEQREWEGYILQQVALTPTPEPQDDEHRNYIKAHWIRFAHAVGDMSYLVVNGNKPLYPDVVTY